MLAHTEFRRGVCLLGCIRTWRWTFYIRMRSWHCTLKLRQLIAPAKGGGGVWWVRYSDLLYCTGHGSPVVPCRQYLLHLSSVSCLYVELVKRGIETLTRSYRWAGHFVRFEFRAPGSFQNDSYWHQDRVPPFRVGVKGLRTLIMARIVVNYIGLQGVAARAKGLPCDWLFTIGYYLIARNDSILFELLTHFGREQ